MSLISDHSELAAEYEAVTVLTPGAAWPVFVRRSSRPSRRAVLHLHEIADSLAPVELVRWYNERGFHFYLTDIGPSEPAQLGRRRSARSQPPAFSALDAACAHLREKDGIDAIILSADGPTALSAAQWCDARSVSHKVDALILSSPEFGRERVRLDIQCPVLVISAGGPSRGGRRDGRGAESVRLGQHVTWLRIDALGDPLAAAAPVGGAASSRRLFDEMGRWLGAYMYGQLRDQLL
jgi:hypothetical protein